MSDLDKNLAARIRKALQEAGVLLLVLVALMLLLALFSFNPADPGWNQASRAPASNLMGLSGAWLADVLFSLLGFAAWLLPAALLHLSIQLLRRRWEKEDWDPFIPSLRFLGFVLLVVGVAALAARHFYASPVNLPYGSGGILGESLSSFSGPLLGHLGATLVFICACIAGFSLITGWSWLMIMDELGHLLVGLVEKAHQAFAEATALRREEQRQYYEKEQPATWVEPALDQSGAEQTLEHGDMPYPPTGVPDYEESILTGDVEAQALAGLEAESADDSKDEDEDEDENDPLYDEAVAFVIESRKASTSAIQRRFKIGYNRAVSLVDAMERAGLVSPLQPDGQRQLRIPER